MFTRLYNDQYSVIFVVGEQIKNDNYELMQSSLKGENKKYGDILQCEFLDSYHALPIKVNKNMLLISMLLSKSLDILL